MFANGDFSYCWRVLLVLLGFFFGTQTHPAPNDLQLENELLLELRLDGEGLGLDILGYQRNDEFLLSLEELTAALGFPIAVDAAQGSASGWYISENREFSLDLATAVVISDGKNWPIADGNVVVFEGGLYVDTKALEKWFPLRLFAVVRELYLNVEPAEPLPMQLRVRRRERVNSVISANNEAIYPLQDTPYQFFSPHITKLTSSYSTVRQTPGSDATTNIDYASLSRGDLGWMTSTLSLAGRSEDSLTAAKLKLERTAFDGPASLNHLELGDIEAGGAGILLRGGDVRKTGERFDNESVSLEGSQLPDWDVELYRNDQLMATETTGPDGSYFFEDIPLQFGQNHFELKFFGPNGELDSREEFHFLGKEILQAGSISYQASAIQSGRSVFGLGEEEPGQGVYSSAFNLGLSSNLTVGAGVTSSEINGERLNSSNVSLGLGTSRFYASANYAVIPDAQNSVEGSLRTQLGRAHLNLLYTRFFDSTDLTDSPNKWQTAIDLTSSVFTAPIRLEATVQEQENFTANGVSLGTTLPLLGAGKFSSSLSYSSFEQRSDDGTTRTSQLNGQSSLHTTIRPWSFRLSANYSFEPDAQLERLGVESRLRIDKGLSLGLDLARNNFTDTIFYAGSINWQLDQVAINARVAYDSNERWSGFITFSTTLFHQPGTLIPRLDSRGSVNSGSVEVRVFEDVAGTQREAQSGVRVEGVQAWRRATTNERGVAYLSGIPSHRQIDIELDESTLSEYDLQSTNPGVSVIGRPGSYTVVEFPIIRTVELEGHVVVAGDEKRPVSRAVVLLKTPEGEVVARTRTAFDGFFLFEGIEPGTYQVSLDESIDHRVLTKPDSVTALGNSDVITALDFTLSPANEEVIAQRTLVQQEASSQQPEPDSSSSVPVLLARPLPEAESLAKPPVLASALQEVESPAEPQEDEGTWFVQIGAYGSREIALASWERAIQGLQALQGKTPRFVQYQNMTRLLVGPGRSRDTANELCQRLKAGSMDCLVRSVEQ